MLNSKEKHRLREVFQTFPDIQAVFLFGSAASGKRLSDNTIAESEWLAKCKNGELAVVTGISPLGLWRGYREKLKMKLNVVN